VFATSTRELARGLRSRRQAARHPPILREAPVAAPQAIAIGGSTGGPQALLQVLKHLAPDAGIPILITQHMAPGFASRLAGRLSWRCGVRAVEAEDGMRVAAGAAFVAPDDFHMRVDTARTIRLDRAPAENLYRPAIDPMLRSLAAVYGERLLVLMLSGMGRDGLEGCREVVEAGGAVCAQDEASSMAWGMPGAVACAGLCFRVLPLAEIGPCLRRLAHGEA